MKEIKRMRNEMLMEIMPPRVVKQKARMTKTTEM
jgi:hypothetical protein